MNPTKTEFSVKDKILYFILQQALDSRQPIAVERVKATYNMMTPENKYRATPTRLTAMHNGDITGLELAYAPNDIIRNSTIRVRLIEIMSIFLPILKVKQLKALIYVQNNCLILDFIDVKNLDDAVKGRNQIYRFVINFVDWEIITKTRSSSTVYNLNGISIPYMEKVIKERFID